MKKINYAGPSITKLEIDYVNDAIKNGFYQNYKLHNKNLEKIICKKFKTKFSISLNSCTSAIHIGLLSLGVKKGDEVITTDATCVASALPIKYVQATPVFVDVDPLTWCIDPEKIEKAITKKTKVIIVVHWNGYPAYMEKIMKISKKYNIKIIEDAAAAMGAKWKKKYVGTFGEIGTFSFQGAKIAIGGMGGALITKSKKIYKIAKIFSEYGRTDSKKMYWSDYIGFNYGMPNLSAALATAQIKRLDNLVKLKRKIYKFYEDELKNFKKIELKKEYFNSYSTYCYPIIEVLSDDLSIRDKLLFYLGKFNIDARCSQPKCSSMPIFSKRFKNPVSNRVENFGIILPAAYNLSKKDIKFVTQKIKDFFI